MSQLHIIPDNDRMVHIPDASCPCNPEETSPGVFLHNAADRRERTESRTGKSAPGKQWTIFDTDQ